MEYRQVEYFRAVCEKGSFSKAAEAVFISPQGLGKAIRQLENELDVRLFDRLNGRVTLTPCGKWFYDHSKEYIRQHHQLVSGMDAMREEMRNAITICINSGVCDCLPEDFLIRFMLANPDIEVSIISCPTKNQESGLEEFPDHVWIGSFPKVPEGYTPVYQKENELFLIVGEGHRFYDRESVSFAELRGETIINNPVGNFNMDLDDSLNRIGVMPRFMTANADRRLTLGIVAHNLAISFHAADFYKQIPSIHKVRFSDYHRTLITRILVPDKKKGFPAVQRFSEYVWRELGETTS